MSDDKKEEGLQVKSPVQGGWRGHVNGTVEATRASTVKVEKIVVELDSWTAWALCNLLDDRALERANAVENEQIPAMSNLGAAIGRLIDHPSANNGGRQVIK